MPAKIIDGKKISEAILAELKKQVSELKENGIQPCLAVLLVGNNTASALYVQKKEAACNALGIKSIKIELEETATEKALLQKIKELNENSEVHGILVQLPLPKQIERNKVLQSIAPEKDVDGFTAENLGMLALGIEELVSCTALGIIKLIDSTGIELKGKNCCIVNHSIVVGRPLMLLLLNRNATVVVCHEFTKNLSDFTKSADVLISAVGMPSLIKKEMVKQGAIVIDAGIARFEGKVVGDVDFNSVKGTASFITPVPGGVGPMTVACLMLNTVKAAERALPKNLLI